MSLYFGKTRISNHSHNGANANSYMGFKSYSEEFIIEKIDRYQVERYCNEASKLVKYDEETTEYLNSLSEKERNEELENLFMRGEYDYSKKEEEINSIAEDVLSDLVLDLTDEEMKKFRNGEEDEIEFEIKWEGIEIPFTAKYENFSGEEE